MARYAPQTVLEKTHRTPILITPEDYEREWKPKGWRLIYIGPTSTWREDWGEWEAIRDIVQNCLDETETYQYGFDHEGLWIADKGSGVVVEDFLLGPPKLKPDWARGKFGEGMKIASLALLRLGHSVHVNTVNRELWVIFTEQPVNGRVDTLAAMWKPNGTRKGTRFHIIGYRGSAYDYRFAVNLPPSYTVFKAASDIDQPKQRYNQLIRTEMISKELGGESLMYCRDIFFRTIRSPFSYNLWGFKLAPDRHGPEDEREMWQDAGRLWSMCTKIPLLAELLFMVTDPPRKITDETEYLEFGNLRRDPITGKRRADIMLDNSAIWKRAWEQAFGKGVVLETNSNLRNMVEHLGYSSRRVKWSLQNIFVDIMNTDLQLIHKMAQKLQATEIIPDHKLPLQELNNLKLARALARQYKTGPVYAAEIPPASDMVSRTAGTYEFDTHIIHIHKNELRRGSTTVGTMVHEIGHHVAYELYGMAGAGDLSEGHARAMEKVSGEIVMRLAMGDLDDYLKDIVW
jgi:hypothetical protein